MSKSKIFYLAVLRAKSNKLNDTDKLACQIKKIAPRIALKNDVPKESIFIQMGYNGSDFADDKISIAFCINKVNEYMPKPSIDDIKNAARLQIKQNGYNTTK